MWRNIFQPSGLFIRRGNFKIEKNWRNVKKCSRAVGTQLFIRRRKFEEMFSGHWDSSVWEKEGRTKKPMATSFHKSLFCSGHFCRKLWKGQNFLYKHWFVISFISVLCGLLLSVWLVTSARSLIDQGQGSTNSGIMQSWIGEHGEHRK